MLLDNIANLLLIITRVEFIIPLIIIGYIWIDRDIFYRATCLLLISIICNFALKLTFAIPRPLAEGFALPSGHMQSAAVFYGWLLFKFKHSTLGLLLIALLAGVGFSLVHFKYHNYYDVLAAVFFATLLIIIYHQTITKFKRLAPWLIILFTTLLCAYIYFKTKHISQHIYMAYYGLLGFMFSQQLFGNGKIANRLAVKILATILSFACMLAIIMFLPKSALNFQWLLISFSIPCLSFLARVTAP